METQNDVRFLSYNVFMRPPGIKNNESDHKDHRLKLIGEVVLPKFDVVGLQEMFGSFSGRRRRLLDDAAARGFPHSAVSPKPRWLSGRLIDGGLVILSRHPVVKHTMMHFSQSMQADALAAKGVLWAHVALPGGRHVHVFNTHLQASYNDPRSLARSQQSLRVRESQMREMVAFVAAQTADDDDPIVVLGDFNVDGTGAAGGETDSKEYALLLSLFAGHGFEPEDLLKLEAGQHPATVGVVHELDGVKIAKETVLTTAHDQFWPKRLDYIFRLRRLPHNDGEFSPEAKAGQFAYVPGTCRVNPFFHRGTPFTQLSDHYGVEAVFRCGPAPSSPRNSAESSLSASST